MSEDEQHEESSLEKPPVKKFPFPTEKEWRVCEIDRTTLGFVQPTEEFSSGQEVP